MCVCVCVCEVKRIHTLQILLVNSRRKDCLIRAMHM